MKDKSPRAVGNGSRKEKGERRRDRGGVERRSMGSREGERRMGKR